MSQENSTNQQSSRSGKLLAIFILGSLGPLVLLLVPVIGIFVAPLTCLVTTGLVVQVLRSGLAGKAASTVACIALLLTNFAAAYVALGVLRALQND